MIRRLIVIALLGLQVGSLEAQELPIRAGEHASYSRLVIPAPTDIAWELRTAGRRTILSLPGLETDFSTDQIFDRIPKSRILSVDTSKNGDVTEIIISLACNCGVDAKVEGGSIILDVNDPDDNISDPNQQIPSPEAMVSDTAVAKTPDIASKSDTTVQVSGKPKSRPETSNTPEAQPNSPAELAERLITQLNRAAEQGFVELAKPNKPAEDTETKPKIDEQPPKDVPTVGSLLPQEQALDGLEDVGDRIQDELNSLLGDDVFGGTVRITIPEEFQQDEGARKKGNRKKEEVAQSQAPQDHCIDDEELDVAFWADERKFSEQLAALQGRVFGEFDKPNSEAVLELVRLYIYFGLGTEATALLRDLNVDDRAANLLQEISNTVEGKPFKPDGMLDRAAGCSGVVSLWRTAAIDTNETQPISNVDDVLEYFSELPVHVRRIIGPRLVSSLMGRGQHEAAQSVFDIVERAAGYHGDAHELMRAALLQQQGNFSEAEEVLWRLVYQNSEQSDHALIALVEGRLKEDTAVPSNVIRLLETQAFQNRGSLLGQKLKLTEVKAKAGSGGTRVALSIIREQIAKGSDAVDEYGMLANQVLTETTFDELGVGEYANMTFENSDLIDSDIVRDEARLNIIEQMLRIGLPNQASAFARKLDRENNKESVLQISQALIRQDRMQEALEALTNANQTTQISSQIAVILSRLDRHGEAYEMVIDESDPQLKSTLAWRNGSWEVAASSNDKTIADLSKYMLENITASNREPREDKDDDLTLEWIRSVQSKANSTRDQIKTALQQM